MKKKILFCSGGTGGHVFPSISLINFFKKREYETILVIDKRGAKYLKKDLKRAVKKYSDNTIKSHLNYCISMIDEALKNS